MTSTMAATLHLPQRGILSLVGAGGKTTAMYRLARELSALALRTICTTTTKIFPPDPDLARLILVEDNPQFLDSLDFACSLPLCLAWKKMDPKMNPEGKVTGLPPALIHQIFDSGLCDWLLVEADGARRLPLKAPASHEPLIPERSTHVLGLIGLSAMGTPLDENHVCRAQRYAELTGLAAGAAITPSSVAALCAHPEGLFKNAPRNAQCWIWLNQADEAGRLAAGREILTALRSRTMRATGIILGAVESPDCVMERWLP